MPVWTLTDAIAIVWDPSMYQTPNNPNDKQTISLYQGSNYIRKVTYSITPASPGHAAICRFPMLYDEWNNYWSKSASGVVYLGQPAKSLILQLESLMHIQSWQDHLQFHSPAVFL